MATYTVNLTGSLNSSYGYATINGTKITTTGTKTYTSKPTIAVYVGGGYFGQADCKVTLNGATVKSGQGSYTVDIGDNDTVNINFNVTGVDYQSYYTCDITTETSTPPDPMAPHDGHNTNIGSVAREIEGGTVLIGGVLREIESGLVLVGGVAREIEFGPSVVTIEISGTAPNAQTWITIGGTNYTSAATLNINAGEEIVCRAYGLGSNTGKITLNGETVASKVGGAAEYSYVAKHNATITIDGSYTQSTVAIVEDS